MKMKKLSKVFALAIATSLMALSLTACGSSKGDVKTAKKPVPASEAFTQEGVWFYLGNDGIISKDEIVSDILVFDGKGNVTVYNCSDIKFSDLKALSDDEIITLAKEQDKKIFDDGKKSKSDDIQEGIDSNQMHYDSYKQELDSKSYKTAKTIGAFSFYSDDQISSNPNIMATIEEWYNENLTKTDSQIKELENRKSAIDKLEYKEPLEQPVNLHIQTDKSGNSTELEMLTYTYNDVNWGVSSNSFGNGEKTAEYTESNKSIKLQFDYGLGTVYDMNFRGFGSIVTLVSENHAGFIFDTPDTKGIEVD